MKIDQQIKFIVINKQAKSLYSLIADEKYHATSLGRDTWKILIGPDASLQTGCNTEGFNSRCTKSTTSARIGILGNGGNICDTCDSKIGFGTGGHPDDPNTCGNAATGEGDNGAKRVRAMGYILVQ